MKTGNKWGFIDRKGVTVIPFDFDETGEFSDGLAIVAQNKKVKFIDRTGKVVFVLNKKYDWAEDFVDGTAIVLKSETKRTRPSFWAALSEVKTTYYTQLYDEFFW